MNKRIPKEKNLLNSNEIRITCMLIYFESFEVGERNCGDWSHCVALDKVKTTDCGFVPNGYWQIEWMNLHLFNGDMYGRFFLGRDPPAFALFSS